jgi:hypothetical protein
MENRLVNGLVIYLTVTVAGTIGARPAAHSSDLRPCAREDRDARRRREHGLRNLRTRERATDLAERNGALDPPPDDPATFVVKLQPESEAVRYGVRSVC